MELLDNIDNIRRIVELLGFYKLSTFDVHRNNEKKEITVSIHGSTNMDNDEIMKKLLEQFRLTAFIFQKDVFIEHYNEDEEKSEFEKMDYSVRSSF